MIMVGNEGGLGLGVLGASTLSRSLSLRGLIAVWLYGGMDMWWYGCVD